jgi:outer membrane lipoprotein SlyB
MKKGLQKKVALGMTLILLGTSLSSCGYVSKGIEYSDLQTKITLSNTIFLDPELKQYNKTIYIEVSNTSDFNELSKEDLKKLIAEKLSAKGYQITQDAAQAGYILRVNLKHMDYSRKTGATEGGHEGFLAGATAGASAGHDTSGAIAGAIIGGIIGNIGGSIIGKMIKIEKYSGTFEIELREKLNKKITGKIVSNANLGTSTQIQTENPIETDWQIYRTNLYVTMEQTNLNRVEAAKVIAEKVATSIAELF